MINLISNMIARVSSLLKGLQVKRFLAVVMLGVLLLTTNTYVTPGDNKAFGKEVRDRAHLNDTQRPRTVGEWQKEAEEVKGNPAERIKRIGEDSAEAFRDFGSGYVEGAKKTGEQAKNSAVDTGKDAAKQVRR
ncbi:hypothetical protein CEN41_11455 [Fischerella thermalis CCMEE 5330]|uniref:Uncharacterized protein n=1 Tax=Fischerella thermalis CCMEE 5330 TaxID=2019670 RepID=A0A2N6MB65_9CYAN|nr:hypothetical protein [Fischerella thermalis]PMB44029.1 hypothetical protein CEN41_11455 [Fischerella thermalis CCMEE 5330]